MPWNNCDYKQRAGAGRCGEHHKKIAGNRGASWADFKYKCGNVCLENPRKNPRQCSWWQDTGFPIFWPSFVFLSEPMHFKSHYFELSHDGLLTILSQFWSNLLVFALFHLPGTKWPQMCYTFRTTCHLYWLPVGKVSAEQYTCGSQPRSCASGAHVCGRENELGRKQVQNCH